VISSSRNQERRDLELPEPLEEPEQVVPRVVELRHHLEDWEGVDREDRHVHRLVEVVDVHLEDLEPGLARELLQLLPDQPEVQHAQLRLEALDVHPEARDVLQEAIPGLLEGDVDAPEPVVLRVVVQGVERDGGLHRARLARDQDDVGPRDPALELLVQASDVRPDAGHGHGGLPRACGRREIKIPGRFSAAATTAYVRTSAPTMPRMPPTTTRTPSRLSRPLTTMITTPMMIVRRPPVLIRPL